MSDIDRCWPAPMSDRDRWDDLVALLGAEGAAWTGNHARVLEVSESQVFGAGRDEPVLSDVVAHGPTVAAGLPGCAERFAPRRETMPGK